MIYSNSFRIIWMRAVALKVYSHIWAIVIRVCVSVSKNKCDLPWKRDSNAYAVPYGMSTNLPTSQKAPPTVHLHADSPRCFIPRDMWIRGDCVARPLK